VLVDAPVGSPRGSSSNSYVIGWRRTERAMHRSAPAVSLRFPECASMRWISMRAAAFLAAGQKANGANYYDMAVVRIQTTARWMRPSESAGVALVPIVSGDSRRTRAR